MDHIKKYLLFIGLAGSVVILAFFFKNFDKTKKDLTTQSKEKPKTSKQESVLDPSQERESIKDTPLFELPLPLKIEEERKKVESIYLLESKDYKVKITNLNTGIVSFRLKKKPFLQKNGELLEIISTNKERYFPFRIYIDGMHISKKAAWSGKQLNKRSVQFHLHEDGIEVVRLIRLMERPYQLFSSVQITNKSGKTRTLRLRYFTHHYVTKAEESEGFIARPSVKKSYGICFQKDEEKANREDGESLSEKPMFFLSPVFAGIHDTYFSNLLISYGNKPKQCVLGAQLRPHPNNYEGILYQAELRYDKHRLSVGESFQEETLAYIGPNDRNALKSAGPYVDKVIDLGWFSFIANGFNDLLGVLYRYVGNWGLAIIVLTLLVKLLFYPLTLKSFRSMATMRKLKPKIDAINEKYGNDREKKGAAMMEMYRKEKINPAAGCLPSLLQMPVWFALYRSLSTNIELYKAPFFFWLTDLSIPDPFFVLPVLAMLLMHIQQRITPSTMDHMQAKIFMYVMPVMFGAFLFFLPAGLCLYIVTNSALTMAQQKWIYTKLDPKSKIDHAN